MTEAATRAVTDDAGTLARFVASGLLGSVGIPDGDDAAPTARRVDAAMLVADVSGFTALTTAMTEQHGRAGSDQLSMLISEALGALADIAHRHGGAVLDIIGDSIQVVWVAEGGDTDAALACAAGAALAMAAAEGERFHFGIAAGLLELAVVGGRDGDWELVGWGAAMDRACAAAAAAATGQCVVADPASLRDRGFGIEALPGGTWRLASGGKPAVAAAAPVAQPVDSAAALLSSSVKSLAASNALGWAAELRLVTAMFVRLAQAREPLTAARLHRAVRAVQDAVVPHGGVVDKVHTDDKGVAALVVFGLPPTAPAGTALRAVQAANTLRSELRELGIDLAVGIATGRVRAGVVGGTARAHYTVFGPAINLAARCMAAATDEMLCDETTRAAAGRAAEFFAPEARSLKGIASDTQVYAVGELREARRDIALDDTPVAGRGAELAAIDGFLAGPGRVLLLTGEVGVGKSRLAAAAIAAAGARDVVVGRAGQLSMDTPFAAWREPATALLRGWARTHDVRLGDALGALVADAGEAPDAVALLAGLFGRERTEGARGGVGTGEERGRRLRQLSARVVARLIGDGPRLAVLDDAQWLDGSSATLAFDLLAALPQLKLVVAGRVPLSAAVETHAADSPDLVRLDLAALGRDGTADIAREVLGAAGFDPAHPFVDWLHAHCRGNPLFTRALIDALPRELVLKGIETRGAWREAEAALDVDDLPATVEDAAAVKLGRLPPGQVGVLRAASVADDDFDLALLAALEPPVGPGGLSAELSGLTDAGLLARTADDGAPRWRFAQALMRDIVYASLPAALRTSLHARAAEHLADSVHDREIAHHWIAAGEPAKAFAPLRRAGVRDAWSGAFADATTRLEAALALITSGAIASPPALRQAQLRQDLSAAHECLGELTRAVDHAKAGLAHLGSRLPASRFGWTMLALRELILIALPAGRRPLAGSRRVRFEYRLRAQLGGRIQRANYFLSDPLEGAAMALYATRAAERGGAVAEAGQCYAYLGMASGLLRLHGVARNCFARLRRAGLEGHVDASLRDALGGEGLYSLAFGRWEHARRRLRQFGAVARRMRMEERLGHMHTLLGISFQLEGRFAEAEIQCAAVRPIAEAGFNDHLALFDQTNYARQMMPMGDLDGAAKRLEVARSLLRRTPDRQSAMITEGLLAATRTRRGERVETLPALVDQAEATPLSNFGSWDGFAGVAEAALGDYAAHPDAAARKLAARAVRRLDQFASLYAFARPLAALHRGQLAAIGGKRARAAAIWRKGLAAAAGLGTRYDALRLADALARSGNADVDAAPLAAACGVPGAPWLPLASPS